MRRAMPIDRANFVPKSFPLLTRDDFELAKDKFITNIKLVSFKFTLDKF